MGRIWPVREGRRGIQSRLKANCYKRNRVETEKNEKGETGE